MAKKYKLVKSSKVPCKDSREHSFSIIRDEDVKEEIGRQYPKTRIPIPLWECSHCSKITQSM